MRPLHRPMFRYGGPIKEGIMSGIRESKRKGGSMGTHAALVGNPIFPKTAGREHHQIDYRFNPKDLNPKKIKDKVIVGSMTKVLPKVGIKPGFLNPYIQSTKNWWLRNKPTAKWRQPPVPKGQKIGDKYIPAPYSKWEIARNPKLWWRAARENPKTAIGTGYVASTDPGQAVIGGIPAAGQWVAEALTPGFAEKYLPWNKKKELPPPPPGDGTSIFETEEVIEPKKSDEQIRNERIQKYRDIMDIKGMNKRAAYDSLIDASKLIQESGDFKGDIKSGKLINDIIQATSKQFDKPAKTKDAIDTLILKGEIEADIASGKAGTYQKNIDAIASNLNISKADAAKMILSKPINLREQVTTDMAATKQAAVTHKGLVSSTKKQYPKAQVMLTQDEYEDVVGDDSTGEAFIKQTVKEKLSKDPNAKVAGVYIVGKEVVQVDGAGNTLTLFP